MSSAVNSARQWGILDLALLARLDDLVGPTTIEGVSHRVEGDNLVVRIAVTRCCVESLSWRIVVGLFDPASGTTLRGANSAAL